MAIAYETAKAARESVKMFLEQELGRKVDGVGIRPHGEGYALVVFLHDAAPFPTYRTFEGIPIIYERMGSPVAGF
jgi:hypothetical protein